MSPPTHPPNSRPLPIPSDLCLALAGRRLPVIATATGSRMEASPGPVLLPPELPYPPGQTGHLGQVTLEHFSDSQAYTDRPGDIQPPQGRTGGPGGPVRSTSCLLAHLPIAISVVSPGILQGQPPPGRWARPPLSRHLACWHQGGPRCTGALEGSEPTRSNPGSQRGHLWFAGERRLNFKKWWHKGMGTCQASHLGVVLSLFLKPLKCKTSFCTFLHFFFFSPPGFLFLFINILSGFSNGVIWSSHPHRPWPPSQTPLGGEREGGERQPPSQVPGHQPES